MNKFLMWCGRRAIEVWTVLQWTILSAIGGLIVAAAVITFISYAAVILARWVM